MALSLLKNPQLKAATAEAVRVLLVDTPENRGIDFLQSLQRQEVKLAFERVNDREGMYAALKQGNWDILLACDQVKVPGPEDILACLAQLDCETAFVVLSTADLNIEVLTRAYRLGISALVSAGHPEYSLEVFAREAERSRRNFQLSLLNQEKFELKRHCQQLMSGTEEALAYLQDGIHVYGNDAYLRLLGYQGMDDLVVMPFIDIVAPEGREKTKHRLLDFQHKVRVQPDTKELEVRELFINGVGEKAGVLQVSATFKPVVYDGDDCIQVVFKIAADPETREESGAMEGLGYPLFITHLDNLISEARQAGQVMGRVLHVRGTGLEHYIAGKGFGSLNGKLKALASEMKAGLGRDDLLIRFTENSFLALLRESGGSTLPDTLTALLARFDDTLNHEIDAGGDGRKIVFEHDVIPVDAHAGPAEALVRHLLLAGPWEARPDPAPVAENNVIPFSEKQEPAAEAAVAGEPASDAAVAGVQAQANSVETGNAGGQQPVTPEEGPGLTNSEAPVRFEQHQLNAALHGNGLQLMFEAVMSVKDIDTEFHDIGLYLDGNAERICPGSLGSALNHSPLAAKLDQWSLDQALSVIADLYNQGQEYPVILTLSARSLADKRLAHNLGKQLAALGLPGAMVMLDFAIGDLNAEPAAGGAQLDRLKALGMKLCLSGVYHLRDLKPVLDKTRVDLIRLQDNFVTGAVTSETTFALLRQSVDKLHGMKMKVLAGDINGNEELSACCKAGLDLVQGRYIQKSPLPLSADSLAQEMMI